MNIYSFLARHSVKERLVLATIIKTRGSTPQVSGASALFSERGLEYGTVGGGILESTVTGLASKAVATGSSALLEFNLDAKITDTSGAICGGAATVLLDAGPASHKSLFIELDKTLSEHRRGVLITSIRRLPDRPLEIERHWVQEGGQIPEALKKDLSAIDITSLLNRGENVLIKNKSNDVEEIVFLEPVSPVKKLLIIGGGHIGKALCHIAGLVDFEITIIDDRPDIAVKGNFPEAVQVICGKIEEELKKIHIDSGTYIVIVTQGHLNDAAALKQCIHRGAAYIGMIGSRRKIRLVKDKFIKNNWADKRELDAIHAPIGLDIGSETVPEIAISIAAELIKVSRSGPDIKGKQDISVVILAAGTSSRMGEPKMLLPYRGTTIIETVAETAVLSKADHVLVVTGSQGPEIRDKLSRFPIDVVANYQYESGMLSSVQTGLRSVPGHIKAVLIMLGDQPMVSTGVIDQLIDAYNNHAERLLVPVFNGRRGHPLMLDMSFKKDVEHLDPQKGLRQLIIENPGEVLEVAVDSPGILKDIDTKEDYESILNELSE